MRPHADDVARCDCHGVPTVEDPTDDDPFPRRVCAVTETGHEQLTEELARLVPFDQGEDPE